MDLTPVTELRALKCPIKDVVLVDTSWLLHRSFHAYSLSVFLNGIEVPTGDIFGVLRALQMVVRRKPFAAIIFCIDSFTSDKKKINPTYKDGRGDKTEVYRKLEQILVSASTLPNVFISGYPDKEADEVIHTWALKLSEHLKVHIYACDRDLHQSVVNSNIEIFQKAEKNEFLSKTFDDISFEWGIHPTKIPLYRAIRGDSSDNLPGYERFPDALAKEITRKFNSPEEFLASTYVGEKDSEKKWTDLIRSNPDLFITNYQIMRLDPVQDCQIFKSPGSWEFIDMYKMQSIRSTFQSYISQSDG